MSSLSQEITRLLSLIPKEIIYKIICQTKFRFAFFINSTAIIGLIFVIIRIYS